MAHHAYVTEGTQEETISKARLFAANTLGLTDTNSPDILTYTFGHFSVDDARRIITVANQSGVGNQKVLVMYAARLFHEAQNALLKVFEEPSEGVTVILGVPTKGILLPTLRSRLIDLPGAESVLPVAQTTAAQEFLTKTETDRGKYLTKLIDRTKSDNDEAKQGARMEAVQLLQGLTALSYERFHATSLAREKDELREFLTDLTAFAPLMHERATPFKLIFEHLQLVIPRSLSK
jgi:DNA polymerase III delta prime subunit